MLWNASYVLRSYASDTEFIRREYTNHICIAATNKNIIGQKCRLPVSESALVSTSLDEKPTIEGV